MARPYLPSFFGRGDDPFGSLFREVQKTFEDFSQRGPFAHFGSDILSPKVDIAESKDAIEVTAELPGVDEKDLDVTLANGMLTVRGEKKSARDEQDKDKNWHVVERSYGSFSRAIPLPFDPDPTKVEAKFDKGVLHIHLPKPAEGGEEAAEDRDQESLKHAKRRLLAAQRPRCLAGHVRLLSRQPAGEHRPAHLSGRQHVSRPIQRTSPSRGLCCFQQFAPDAHRW